MVLEKRQPAFARVTPTTNSPEIPGYAPFRDDEAEFLKLSVDLLGDLRSVTVRSGPPAPVESEPGAVPADDSLGLHDHEEVPPAEPKAAQSSPEQPVEKIQGRPGSFPLEDGDLLSDGEDCEGRVASTAEEDADGGEESEGEVEHELTVGTSRNVVPPDLSGGRAIL